MFSSLLAHMPSIDGWEKKKARFIRVPANSATGLLVGDTRMQFHNDQAHLLVVHETQISIYDPKLGLSSLLVPKRCSPSSSIECNYAHAMVCRCMQASGIFEADILGLRCYIASSSYISSSISGSGNVYRMVVAAHSSEPCQIALGMNDGSMEPLESDTKWARSLLKITVPLSYLFFY